RRGVLGAAPRRDGLRVGGGAHAGDRFRRRADSLDSDPRRAGGVSERRRPPLLLVAGALVIVMAAIAVARAAGGPAGPSTATPAATRAEGPGASPADGGPPPCRFGDREALDDSYEDWRSTILDTTFRLPHSYVPPDLVSVEKAGFPEPQTTRSFVIPDLRRLREAADESGHPIGMIWGYRSYRTQVSVFEHSVAVNGSQHALSHAARP